MQTKQVNIFYSGTVQGVGFRYRSQAIAKSMDIRGWVRNLPDGRVEILAQGNKSDLDDFISTVDAAFEDYIRSRQICWGDTDKKAAGFDITF